MAQNQGNNGGGDSGFVYILVILFIIFGLFIFLGKNFHYVAGAWKFLRTAEICAVSWVPNWVPIFGSLELKEACHFLSDVDSHALAKETMQDFDARYAKFFSWLPASILIALGIFGIKRNGEITQYFDKDTMLNFYEKWFPDILSGVIKDSPLNHPLEYDRDIPETGKYGKSLSPEAFAVLTPPLGLEEEGKKDSSINKPIWNGDDDFDEDLCERSFIKQLGDRYEGRLSLNEVQKKVLNTVHKKVLTSEKDRMVYIKDALEELIIEYSGEKSDKFDVVMYPIFPLLKKHIVTHIQKKMKSKKELDRTIVLEQLIKIKGEKRLFKAIDAKNDKGYMSVCAMFKIERRFAKHAFINSGMMSLLVEAREAGRVDSFANFNWVKEKDRTLWYCLDTVGRNVAWVEAAGVFAHWEIEKIVGKAITHPEVTTAVDAMRKYLMTIPE